MTEQRPSAEEVRAALEEVLSSPGFASAGRLPLFLRHVVERSLEGDTERLKESLLGVEVFQRPADYDPRTDPIVRVEARRLRSRLDEYYAGEGKAAKVRISLPKGGYVPVFSMAGPTAPVAPIAEDVVPMPRGRRLIAWVAGIAVVGILLGWWQTVYMHKVSQARLSTVAVLPFVNVGGDAAEEYFSEGLTEEIADRLSRIPGLKVVPRGLTAPFKTSKIDLREVAERTHAAVVVEGSVRTQGGRLRVVARLSSTADGTTLWSHTYERSMKDLFAVQDELAQSIAGALRVQVRAGGSGPDNNRHPQNLEAYNAYLRGRHQSNLFTVEGWNKAVEYFDEALKLEPDYAPALAGLSQAYGLLGYYRGSESGDAWQKSREAAEKALRLDPSLAEAHAALGMELALNRWQWAEAETEMRKALEADPASATAHGFYAATVLMPENRVREANEEFRKGLELEPLLTFLNFASAYALLVSGQTDEALAQYRRALEMKNIHPDMYWDYGMALGYAGKHAEAARAFRKSNEMRGVPDPERLFGLEAYFSGDVEQAKRDAATHLRLAKEGRMTWMNAARLCAMVGDEQGGLGALDNAVQKREEQVIWIKADPRLKSLRGNPRYGSLVRQVGLQ